MKLAIKLDYDKAVADMFVGDTLNGTIALKMGETRDGKELCCVLGWTTDYEKGDGDYQKEVGGVVYTLVRKLAFNIDDLQCDYDIDWYEPSTKDGDVYDTDSAVVYDMDLGFKYKGDWRYLKDEAKHIISLMNRGELYV